MFELSEDVALLVSGVAGSAMAGGMLLAPHSSHENFYGKRAAVPFNENTMRWAGFSNAATAAYNLSAALEPEVAKASKRNCLKVAGAQWLASAAMNMYYAQEGTQKKETALFLVGMDLVLGVLCLRSAFASDKAKTRRVDNGKGSGAAAGKAAGATSRGAGPGGRGRNKVKGPRDSIATTEGMGWNTAG